MWNVKRVNDLIVISKTGKQLNLKIYIKLKTKKNEKKTINHLPLLLCPEVILKIYSTSKKFLYKKQPKLT